MGVAKSKVADMGGFKDKILECDSKSGIRVYRAEIGGVVESWSRERGRQSRTYEEA